MTLDSSNVRCHVVVILVPASLKTDSYPIQISLVPKKILGGEVRVDVWKPFSKFPYD